MQTVFNVRTSGPGLHEFTADVLRFVRDSGVREGLLVLFVRLALRLQLFLDDVGALIAGRGASVSSCSPAQ